MADYRFYKSIVDRDQIECSIVKSNVSTTDCYITLGI